MKRCFLFYISSIRLHHNRFFSQSPPKICSEISQLRSKTSNYVMQSSQSPRAKQVATSGIACLFMDSNTAPSLECSTPNDHRGVEVIHFGTKAPPHHTALQPNTPEAEKLRVATLHGRLPTSPGSLAHNRLSHSSGTVRNLSFKPPNTSENFKCCTSCSQTLAPFSHTSQTNWP